MTQSGCTPLRLLLEHLSDGLDNGGSARCRAAHLDARDVAGLQLRKLQRLGHRLADALQNRSRKLFELVARDT